MSTVYCSFLHLIFPVYQTVSQTDTLKLNVSFFFFFFLGSFQLLQLFFVLFYLIVLYICSIFIPNSYELGRFQKSKSRDWLFSDSEILFVFAA